MRYDHPQPTTRLLHMLTELELANADPRYPKWASMCRLRRIALPVLNAAFIAPGQERSAIMSAVDALAEATGEQHLMLRSDGGAETSRYHHGGNTFPLEELEERAAALLSRGRAVILLEPTNRLTNRLAAVLRMDRPAAGHLGQFNVEALGPGYDVADLLVVASRLRSL